MWINSQKRRLGGGSPFCEKKRKKKRNRDGSILGESQRGNFGGRKSGKQVPN